MWDRIKEVARLGKWLVIAFTVVAVVASVTGWVRERAARNAADKRTAELIVVNDSTQARLATLTSQNQKLLALKEAAIAMDGTVVAGVRIHVASDTIYVPLQEVPTVLTEDSTRRATLADSTKGYVLHVDAEAPPSGPLKVGYTLRTPEFDPEVGFVKRGEDYYAVVSWAGQEVTTEDAFFHPDKERPLSLVAGAEAYSTEESLHGIAYSALQYRLNSKVTAQLRAAVFGTHPAIGLQVERKLW